MATTHFPKKLLRLLLLSLLLSTTVVQAQVKLNHRDSTYTRAMAVKDYQENYLGSEMDYKEWNGNEAKCLPGKVPDSVHNAIINRINYFRRLVGLNDNCVLDKSKYEGLQKTALLMTANEKINHFPKKDWKCYSEEGAQWAAKSNLHISTADGSGASYAITSFIRDDGDNNKAVGHRRWILYSKQSDFSHGTTNNSMALFVFGKRDNTEHIPEYIAYPPATFVPQNLVFDRWSFAIPDADFSDASVMMLHNAELISTNILSTKEPYGDNAIVWEPYDYNNFSDEDMTYTVVIKNVKNAPKEKYIYDVTIINPKK